MTTMNTIFEIIGYINKLAEHFIGIKYCWNTIVKTIIGIFRLSCHGISGNIQA